MKTELKNTVLGIEPGSSRSKAVLTDRRHVPIASGAREWENRACRPFYSG